MSYLNKFTDKKLISPPSFLRNNLVMEVITGSRAYGCNNEESDFDIAGIGTPTKEMIFPSFHGYLEGFDKDIPKFEQYRTDNKIQFADKEYDLTVFSLIKFFRLAANGTPNCVELLFVPLNCITYNTNAGSLLRDNRHIFLHKDMWNNYTAYARSQIHKMASNKREGKRKELYEKYSFDVKFAYNLVRLISQIEQILTVEDLDLQKHKEYMKSIRRGEVKEEEIRNWFSEKEKTLEQAYRESKLPQLSDEVKIKNLLLNIIEIQYGNISNCITALDKESTALQEIRQILGKAGY